MDFIQIFQIRFFHSLLLLNMWFNEQRKIPMTPPAILNWNSNSNCNFHDFLIHRVDVAWYELAVKIRNKSKYFPTKQTLKSFYLWCFWIFYDCHSLDIVLHKNIYVASYAAWMPAYFLRRRPHNQPSPLPTMHSRRNFFAFHVKYKKGEKS